LHQYSYPLTTNLCYSSVHYVSGAPFFALVFLVTNCSKIMKLLAIFEVSKWNSYRLWSCVLIW
jgi:hypothetical protein